VHHPIHVQPLQTPSKANDSGVFASPKPDAFLAEARAELNLKEDQMEKEWRFDQAAHWNFQ
jgi:hypothetical protein